jgi:hypothetical protein
MTGGELTWSGALHQTFRLLPRDRQSPNLRPFLESDSLTPDELLSKLPYDRNRAKGGGGSAPDPKRYRDGKQVYQTAGLLFEDDGRLQTTDLGKATLRWLDIIDDRNRVVLARHAAYALAACQLRNPTGAGRKYDASVCAFPFSFLWRAMIALDGRITSDELNRALFRVIDEDGLHRCIALIKSSRASNDIESLGSETITGERKNDRIIPWVSLASFGWTLFSDKGEAGCYQLDQRLAPLLKEAAAIRHRHRDFESVREYVTHVARCAALPKDLR